MPGLLCNLSADHTRFNSFTTDLAKRVASDPGVTPTEQTLGLFYSGAFDSAFSRVQADDMRGSALRKSYDEFVARTKRKFSTRANFGLLVGSWRPQDNIHFLGNHPDIGLQYGQEQKRWRVDMVFNFRFTSAKNEYIVDSLGHLVSTDQFSSLLLGLDGGFKFIDNSRFSTDVFVGAGYEAIYSLQKAGDPEKSIIHSSLTASVGLRQRVFLDRRSGWYVGGIVRYGIVDYANAGGTDLSGQTMTISFVTGWCFHATLKQFLKKLNYKGDWRS